LVGAAGSGSLFPFRFRRQTRWRSFRHLRSPRPRSAHPEQLAELAAEVRSFLIENVARTGGHLGRTSASWSSPSPAPGVLLPDDPIIFDTGHQSYVHKLLTGRQDFSALRSRGGLAGYPQRSESPHDVVESSHASSSLSWADGISRAFTATGRGTATSSRSSATARSPAA
jgi:deoxyxylulose-5-phosphate synthase